MTLGELADALNLELVGDGEQVIKRVGTIQSAEAGELCFLANERYRPHLRDCRATAVVLDAASLPDCPVAALVSDNPYADYARAANLLYPPANPAPGTHVSAQLDSRAQVADSASIGPGVVLGPDVIVEDQVQIGAGCILAGNIRVGKGTILEPRVVIQSDVHIGQYGHFHPGVVIGADGFGFAPDQKGWVKVPQVGGVWIGDHVEMGANTTVDRGAIEDTVVENDVKLDNQVQVAHNVFIGAGTVIAGCTAIAGSTRIGRGCMIAGGVGIAGHLTVADGTVITAMTLVSRSIGEAGIYSGSLPMDESAAWRKNSARFRKLDDLARRLAALERAEKQKGE